MTNHVATTTGDDAHSPTHGATRLEERTVAVIGNPNTGKSTLFTALTGVHSRIGNFPGVTVEKKLGWFDCDGQRIRLIDLPGTYSLSPRSVDEMVSVDVLLGRQSDVGPVDAVVCIADASNLERNLYVFSQVMDLGLPTVLVLNMWDVALGRGVQIDLSELSRRLGTVVVPCEAHRRTNVDQVRAAIVKASQSPRQTSRDLFPPAFQDEAIQLSEFLTQSGSARLPLALVKRLLLDVDGPLEVELTSKSGELKSRLVATRERLKAAGCRIPAIEAKLRYAWAKETLRGVMTVPNARPATWTDTLDRWLTHKVWGLLTFCVIMFTVFQAITWAAKPAMELCEKAQAVVGDFIGGQLPPGPVRSLMIDGVVAGVGGILVFLPQICLLFLFIAVFEDCGYMARAAFLMDKLMTKVGLSGKSFVPLMSSFACAIPGIMATRTIENRRDRMVTMLIAPLMSCSARMPVYWLMVATFFPPIAWAGGWITLHGLMLFVMTFFGAVVAIPVAWLFKKTLFQGETPPFVMELPSYKRPSIAIVLHRVYDRASDFVSQAGKLILATSILIWVVSYLPNSHAVEDQLLTEIQQSESQLTEIGQGADAEPRRVEVQIRLDELNDRRNKIKEQLLTSSYLGQFGKFIEPAVKPLGWDWRIGIGVLASFPAREVIVSTLGTIYSQGGDVDENHAGLQSALQSATWPDGRPVYSIPVALSIMVFFALCAQCASTLMVIRREANHWGWAVFTFTYMTLLAYVAAWVTFVVSSQLISA